MTTESESELAKITQSSVSGKAQGTALRMGVHIGLRNSRVVAHEYEPLSVSPAEQASDTGVIR
jgi:hypothetical protein